VPYRVGHRYASSTDPSTWASFEAVADEWRRWPSRYAGPGFVFSAADPFCGIDLDDCRDPDTGEIDAWATEIIEQLASYSEVSPSRTGVKIWVFAALPKRKGNQTKYGRGKVEMFWVGSIHDAETAINLAIAPPPQPQPGQLAVRGQVNAIYRASRDELQVDQFHLNTPSSEVNASGRLSSTSALKVSATSHDLKEWRPLLESSYESGKVPFTVHGWATFDGLLTGRLSFMEVNGNLEVYDFAGGLLDDGPGAEAAGLVPGRGPLLVDEGQPGPHRAGP
jgi:hypothetical protein